MVEINLLCGDAFEEIKKLKTNSIDLVLTDPPYDNTNYMEGLAGVQKRVIAEEFKRVLKPTGNIALFCGYEDKWKWYNIFSDLGFKFIREIIWVYKNPTGFMPMARIHLRKFIAAHETILWFVKSEDYYFNSEGLIEKDWFEHPAYGGIMRLRGVEELPAEKLGVTPKPLKIAEILVKRLSKENDLVLDPFMGTGTFAVACLKLKRNFIGFEIRKDIYEVAKKRVEKFMNKRNSFLNDFV